MEDLKFKLDIETDNDYGRVINAIQTIETSENPDLTKLKILFGEAQRILGEFKISNNEKKTIRGLAYNQDKNSWDFKDLTEDQLLGEVAKGQKLYDTKSVITNLSYLAMFYKKIYTKSKMYEPFFNFNLNLIERTLNNDNVVGNVELKEKVETLTDELIRIEKENTDLKKSIAEAEDNLGNMKKVLIQSLLDTKLLKFYSKIYQDNIKDPELIQAVSYINSVGGKTNTIDLMKGIGIKKQTITKLTTYYPEMFKLTGNTIELVYEEEKVKEMSAQAEAEAVELVEPIETNLFGKIKGVFKK